MNYPIRPINKCNELRKEGLAGFDAETEIRKKMQHDSKSETLETNNDARTAKGIRDPGQPTQAQIDAHNLTHCPFEAWCSHCVRGQAPEDPHKRKKHVEDEEADQGDEERIPKVAIDYCFMGSKGLVKDGEWRDGEGREIDGVEAKDNPILAMQEDGAERIFAYPVVKKGAYEAVVKLIVADIESMGKKKIILKRDQENAIEELAEKVTKYCTAEVVPERSPVGCHQSNAKVERGIRTLGGRIRTLKDSLECKLKCIIPATHPIVQWIIKHAAFTHNICQVKRRSGKTAYEKWRGRKFDKAIAEIGEKVLYKQRRGD